MSVDMSIPILVVDDYRTMARIIRNLLRNIGFSDIDEAADGSEALERLGERDYGLIISDWNMLPMTGYEFLQRVRASERHSKLPFLMVTAESRPENVIAAKKAGASNYIVKPFTADVLRAKIESVLGGSTS